MATTRKGTGCMTAAVAAFPRLFLLLAWIGRPAMMDRMFTSFILPCLGFLFVPWTTLMYVLLYGSGGLGISGLDWLWLGLTLLMDVAMIGSTGAANRDRIPAGVPGSSQTPDA